MQKGYEEGTPCGVPSLWVFGLSLKKGHCDFIWVCWEPEGGFFELRDLSARPSVLRARPSVLRELLPVLRERVR